MDSRDLTPEQLHALTDRLRPTLAYLHRLLRRMEAEGFPAQDKLYRTACEAEDRLQHLPTVLHYLGCADVTGRRASRVSQCAARDLTTRRAGCGKLNHHGAKGSAKPSIVSRYGIER